MLQLQLTTEFKQKHHKRVKAIVKELDGLSLAEIDALLRLVKEIAEEDTPIRFQELPENYS